MSSLSGKSTIRSMSKRRLVLAQLSLLMAVMLFLADKSMIYSWIRNFSNMTQSLELERLISQLLAPGKAIYELSQAISFFYLIKMFIVVSVAVMLVLLFFVEMFRTTVDIKKAQTIKVSEVAENNQFTYKMQEKFLC